ncbi:MAG TPA: hypothetical protein VNL71_09545 [Chloroflexota bacterium]|nr:hypothetical protein [Chloroflexota bacterium]
MPRRRSLRFRPSLLVPLALLPGLLGIIIASSHTEPSSTPNTASPTLVATLTHPTTGVPVPTNGQWQPTNLTVQTDALATDPSDHGALIAGTVQGMWRSDDGGGAWKRLLGYPMTSAVLALAAGGNPRLLYAADSDGVIRVRTKQGAWRAIGPSPAPGSIFSLAVSDTAPPVVLAGTAGALYRGVQQGTRWQWRAVAHTDGSSFAAVTWLQGGAQSALAAIFGIAPPVLVSHDGGRTWKDGSQGLPDTLPTVAMLHVDTTPATIILSTMGDGVWERAAGGIWREISAGLPERHAMPLVGSAEGNPLFAGTMGYGVYMKNGANSWQRLGRGLTGPSYIVLSLLHVEGRRPILLAGAGIGVYRYALGR